MECDGIGLFKRGKMPRAVDCVKFGAGDAVGDLPMRLDGANLLLGACQHQRRAGDVLQARAAVGAVDRHLRLLVQRLGAGGDRHVDEQPPEVFVLHISGGDEARPGIENIAGHALVPRLGERRPARGGIGLRIRTRRRVDQDQAGEAFGRLRGNLQRRDAAQRKAEQQKPLRRLGQQLLRHGRHAARAAHPARQDRPLMIEALHKRQEQPLVAGGTRQEDERHPLGIGGRVF